MESTLNAILEEIEQGLRELSLWETQSPSPEALASEMPFCYDTLQFSQWLQWVFLPRTRMLARNRRPLPTQSDIHTLAEYWFEQQQIDGNRVLAAVRRFDELCQPP